MGIKNSLKCSINLSRRFCRRSLAATLTFSLLFSANANIKVHAGAKLESMSREQLQQMPFDKLQARQELLEQRLEGQTKGTGEYTQTVQDLTEVAQVSIDQKNAEITLLNTGIEEQQKKIDEHKAKIEDLMDKFKQVLAAIYEAGETVAFVNLYFQSSGLADFMDTFGTVEVINKNYTETFQGLENEAAELDKQQNVLETEKQELSKVLQSLEERRQKFEKFMQDNAEAIDELRREHMSAAHASESAEQAGSVVLSGVSRSGRFIWPLPGHYMISSPFGDGRNHLGIDITGHGVYGAQIVAAAYGVVTYAGGSGGGYGKYVEINHGDGYSTLYAHQSVIAVRSGQTVKQGQVIGYVGNSGRSYGAHLHFETRLNGMPYNPQTEV